jgi:hypothetical protein
MSLTAGDPLEQLHLVRRVGAHPEPSAGDEHPGNEGGEVHLAPGLLLRAERGPPVLGLRAEWVGHR